MASSIPASDGEFYRLLKAMVKWMKSVAPARGFDSAFINDELEPGFKAFEEAYLPCVDKEHRTKDMIARKNEKKKAVKPLYSKAIKMINGNLQTTDDERITLGIALGSGGTHFPTPPMTTAPVAESDTSQKGRLTTHFSVQDSDIKGMPHKGMSIECRRAILDHAPVSIYELTDVFTLHSLEDVQDYDVPDHGKMVYSVYRWVSPTGKPGPWSGIYAVRIP